MKFCQSCTMPLSADTQGKDARYCKHCTDDQGELHPRENVKQGIAQWMTTWQPGINQEQALQRAEHFMNAMPAWAEN
jgi:hypothetical protein